MQDLDKDSQSVPTLVCHYSPLGRSPRTSSIRALSEPSAGSAEREGVSRWQWEKRSKERDAGPWRATRWDAGGRNEAQPVLIEDLSVHQLI